MATILDNTTWTLQCFESRNRDGSKTLPMGEKPNGLIVYTSDGYMSVQIAHTSRSALEFSSQDVLKVSPEDAERAMDSYFAYYGKFIVNEDESIVEHHIINCTFPPWSGQVQKRLYELKDNMLILQNTHWATMQGKERKGYLEWTRVQ